MFRVKPHRTWLTILSIPMLTLVLSANLAIAQKQIFVAVKGSDGAQYAHYTDGLGWDSEWKNVGGIVFGAPDICSPNHGELAVFVRSQNDRTFVRRKDVGGWAPYRLLSEGPNSEPSAVCGGERADVFTVNLKTGELMKRELMPTSDWGLQTGGLYNWGGFAKGAPDACSWGNHRLDVFVRGSDDYIWHRWAGENFFLGDWESLGGLKMTSDPSAVSPRPGVIYVFARGQNNQVWAKIYNREAERWGPWLPWGGSLAGAPDACSWGGNRVDVFARSTKNTLIHRWISDDGKMSPNWEAFSGDLQSDPSAVAVSW